MSEYTKMLNADIVLINRLVFLLEEENIQTMVKNNVESAKIAGFGTSSNDIDLYIKTADFEKAEKIITTYL